VTHQKTIALGNRFQSHWPFFYALLLRALWADLFVWHGPAIIVGPDATL
jgi:hypothetical protein